MTQAQPLDINDDEGRLPDGWRPDASTFGARLALIRQAMGWGNVKEAAVACGIPAESWRTWERDGTTPMRIVDVARRISDRTRCDFTWLLTGDPTSGTPIPAGA